MVSKLPKLDILIFLNKIVFLSQSSFQKHHQNSGLLLIQGKPEHLKEIATISHLPLLDTVLRQSN